MAVLRYDKRGVGESTGDYSEIERTDESSLRKLASDAVMGVRLLARHPAVDETRIGIAGNSQGGWIAPLAAAQTDTVSYLMLWSGPTVSVGLEIYYSSLAAGPTLLDDVYEQLSGFSGIALYEPMPVLQSTTIPSIWLYGALDRSIPVRLDTLNMRYLQSLSLPYEYFLYESARHDLRDVRTGNFVDLWSDWLAWLRRQEIL